MTPTRYRKKPVVIEAMQWTGDLTAARDFTGGNIKLSADGETLLLWVHKSQAWCDVYLEGWMISEPDGSGFYPCSQADFEATYERVDPS